MSFSEDRSVVRCLLFLKSLDSIIFQNYSVDLPPKTHRSTLMLNHRMRRIFCSRGTNDFISYFFVQEVYLLVLIGDHLCAIGG
ncbi:hypothetical protein D4R75_02220 [bacterium]|nr:MAG: hypothetical protein D4R75_02220 [bacterium]